MGQGYSPATREAQRGVPQSATWAVIGATVEFVTGGSRYSADAWLRERGSRGDAPNK